MITSNKIWRRVLVVAVVVGMWLLPQSIVAQTLQCVVADQHNAPIAGASVTDKATGKAVISNSDGTFECDLTSGKTLVFTHPDFMTKEVKVGKVKGKKNVVFHLTALAVKVNPDITDAFGKVTKNEDFLGSASIVEGKDIEKYLAPNILTALQGRMNGLNVQAQRGFSIANITNNSQGSFSGSLPANFGNTAPSDNTQFSFSSRGNAPVVYVDGIERDLFSIDPECIETVSLQKDALSSMFLGMRSSRGAMVITTKNPTKGPLHLSFTSKIGLHNSVNSMKPLSAGKYAYLLNEALQNDGQSPLYDYAAYAQYQNQSDPYAYPNVNWYDELLAKNAISQSYNLNVSGGGERAQYFFSIGYLNEKGLFKTDKDAAYNTNLNLNRYMISSKVNINVTDEFTATMTALGRIHEGNQPGGTGSGYSELMKNIYTTANNSYPVLNPNGTWGGNVSYTNNLKSQAQNSGYISDNARDIMATLKLNYDFSKMVKGLQVNATGSVSSQSATAITRTKRATVYAYSYDDAGEPVYTLYGSPSAQTNNYSDVSCYRYLYGKVAAEYDNSFGLHNISASLAGDTRHELINYDLPSLPSNIMEKVSYDYAKRYFAQIAVTQSYYNRYSPGNRWGNFWAAGLGWDMAKENFMESASWVEKLKLRAVFGYTGNGINNSGYYNWRQTYSDNNIGYYIAGTGMTSPGYYFVSENGLANPYVTWEKAYKLNIGLDANFLSNRLKLTLDYYNDKYFDILQQRGKSVLLIGTTYPAENIGKIRETGAEISLTWQDHIGDLNYYISGNWNIESNKLLFMDEQTQPYDYMCQTGHSVNSVFGLVADGFLTAQDIANGYPVMDGFDNIQPGDVKYKDLNKDGVIDSYDRTIIAGDKPLCYFGLDLGLEWKGLEFSMFWQGAYNRDIYINDRTLLEGFQSVGSTYGQAYENLLARWTPETAATARYPRLSVGGNDYNYGNGYNSSLWVFNGNYIRLKNISLAYNLPELFCRNVLGGLRVKVFVNAQNLVTFSPCNLVDPEVTSYTNTPLQRTIFTGINLKF